MTTDFVVTGYNPYETFYASRYRQGGRTVYALDWSIYELVSFLPKPDPTKVLGSGSSQRKINLPHAKSFGDYIKADREWVSPALLLRAPDIFQFQEEPGLETGTTKFGRLAVPKDAKAEIQIVDGQHRTLGFHFGWESLNDEIGIKRSRLAEAQAAGEPAVIAGAKKALDKLVDRRDQLAQERVSVQIVVVDSVEKARRIFYDINDNAKGITGAVRNRFNDRKVVTRSLNKVLEESDLLEGRVDLEQDRIVGNSRYLLGAKHVADILRALAVGNGRIGKKLEDELDEKQIAQDFSVFSMALLDAFPNLAAVVAGDMTPAEIRSKDLIGSNVVLRAMAAAWWALREDGWSSSRIADNLPYLANGTSLPVYASVEDGWFKTGLFAPRSEGANSPNARTQDLKTLTAFLVSVIKAGPDYQWKRAHASDPALVP